MEQRPHDENVTVGLLPNNDKGRQKQNEDSERIRKRVHRKPSLQGPAPARS